MKKVYISDIDATYDSDETLDTKTIELSISVYGNRTHLAILEMNATVKETAFKLRQLAASLERYDK